MPAQRKKRKTGHVEPVVDPSLQTDSAASDAAAVMDPSVLHPDLAAASTSLAPLPVSEPVAAPPAPYVADHIIETAHAPENPQRKQRKNAAATSRRAAAVAAHLAQQQQQQQQQDAQQVVQEEHHVTEAPNEESVISLDAAAEFLRTIQERVQKSFLPNVPTTVQSEVAPDGSIPTALPTSYPIQQPIVQGSYEGFPTAAQFEEIVNEYVGSLNVKKQAKALLTQEMYNDILSVLLHPFETKTRSPQFRFWAKKMFQLASTPVAHIVIHEHKPVAVKEQIYDILVQCHRQAAHGGRDKTTAEVILTPDVFTLD